ncbi:MAG: hypothetical protein O3A87_12305 [Verrucomicrobia bacterium]|nr:hypothetical protein [Verrucomicrobiota bacterium]MDA1007244.1 hypothetical protein [Verrucomicrobiota bacterium]
MALLLTLKLQDAAGAMKSPCLAEPNWDQGNLVLGVGGTAALTFCNVTIDKTKP